MTPANAPPTPSSALPCRLCRAQGAIVLPKNDSPVVTCTACRRTHPRRLYEPQVAAGPAPSWAIPIAAGCALGVIGLGGVLAVGPLQRDPGPAMNALAVGMSMFFGGMGVRAIQAPTSLRIAASQGTDAWGQAQWGPTHNATAAQGKRMGITFVVVAVLFLVLGIVLGRIVR
jgi:hypothetical protein